MLKRILSLFLSLLMILSLVPTAVSANATDNDIYINDATSMSELINSGVVDGQKPELQGPTNVVLPDSGNSKPTSPEQVTDDVKQVICDCGAKDAPLRNHFDECMLKKHFMDFCDRSPVWEIYDAWYSLDEDVRDFITRYLETYYPNKVVSPDEIDAINDLTDEQIEEGLTGFASATVDGTTVNANGLPEGSSLTVQEPSKEAVEAIQDSMDILSKNPEQVFLYDISVQNDESSDWQPDGTNVKMELSFTKVDLPQYTLVQILHVDDEGNVSTIEGEVDADGNIVFETGGFSTFGGFTVDFEYGSAYYSLRGLLDIYLSELFLNLHMPLQVMDVENVTFSDETLVSVEKLPEDWLLTSLEAFDTQEQLTITMKDGNVYVINVTDAYGGTQDGTYLPDMIVGGGGFDSNYENDLPYADTNDNNGVDWFADGDGNLYTQGAHDGNADDEYWDTHNDGWSRKYTVYVGGAGDFSIVIQVYDTSNGASSSPSASVKERYVQIHQIKILNNANVEFRLGASFDKYTKLTTCYIRPNENIDTNNNGYAANMFIVEDGASLTLKGRAATNSKAACYLTLDGNGKLVDAQRLVSGSTITVNGEVDNQIVRLETGAKNFTASYVRFMDAPRAAIKCRAYDMTNFAMSNCIFDSDVRRVSIRNTGSGGAIYFEEFYNSTYTWIENFSLTNCYFNGCYAAESGGALGLYGRIKEITLTNCHFTDTVATSGAGGAILMGGYTGKLTLSGCTFTRTKATNDNGGAMYVLARVLMNANKTYSRTNEIYITNCTFESTEARVGGALSLRSETEKISISGSSFTNTSAKEGGAIALGYTNLTQIPDGETQPVYMSNSLYDTERNYYSCFWKVRDTVTNDDGTTSTVYKDEWHTTLGTVSITNTSVTGAKASVQGGALTLMNYSSMESLSMDNFDITNCEAVGAGSAVFMSGGTIGTLTYSNSDITGCKTTLEDASEVGGTFRTIGSSSLNATFTNCNFKNNSSHCSGAGIYWNASGTNKTARGVSIDTAASISNCTFDGNYAGWYGGGIFCEARMTVSSCEFRNNEATLMGGGIAFQLYNNITRMFGDNETTSLVLDSATSLHHNIAPVGGGISVRANATQAIENSQAYGHTITFQLGGAQIYNNVATQDGGGVWFGVESYNTATDSGASDQQEVERINKNITLDVGSVYNNSAARHGGGIFMDAGVITDPDFAEAGKLNSNGTCTINVTGAEVYSNEAGLSKTYTGSVGVGTNKTKDDSENLVFSAGTVSGGNGGGIYLTGDKSVCYVNGGEIGRDKIVTTQTVGVTDEEGNPVLDESGNPVTEEVVVSVTYTTAPNKANVLYTTTTAEDGTATTTTSGGNGGGIAVFNGSRIEMIGGNIMYNEAYVGGGIAVRAGSTMTSGLDDEGNCGTVSYNKATSAGGGIAVHDNSAMIVNDGIVSNNQAGYGGGISIMSSTGNTTHKIEYGMVFNGGDVINNWSSGLGGGIVLSDKSTMKLDGGTIKENFASTDKEGTKFADGQEGGGIAVCQQSSMLIMGGLVSENKGYNGGGIAIRGGSSVTMSGTITVDLHEDEVTASSGSIQTNTAHANGGGVYMANAETKDEVLYANTMNITGGWIYNNSVTQTSGGGVFVGDKNIFTITGGRLEDNKAVDKGGAIYLRGGTGNLEGGTICGNSAYYGGGVAIKYSGTANIKQGYIYDNTALKGTVEGDGGAVFSDGGNINITGGEIYENITTNRGTIYASKSNVVIEGGKVYSNDSRYGGGMFLDTSSSQIKQGEIYNNVNSDQGGGIFIRSGSATVSGGSVYGNEASEWGGGYIIDQNAVVTINEGTIRNNKAPLGAGIWIKNLNATSTTCPTVTINGGTISANIASENGGAIWISGNNFYAKAGDVITCSSLTLNGGTITGNVAKGNGGGIYAEAKGVVIVTSRTVNGVTTAGLITGNSGFFGGGIHATGTGTIVAVEGGSITGNFARNTEDLTASGYNGGGIYAGSGATVTMTGGEITTNTAEGDGAGVYATGSADVTIKGGKIKNNTANGNGGGIYAGDSAEVQVTKYVATLAEDDNTTYADISYNTAYNGGGVFVTNGAYLEVLEGHITYNYAIIPEGVDMSGVLTARHKFDELYGAGGGICVANPIGTDVTATFKLDGQNIAIYGNEADFAADDVCANGWHTTLDVRQVADMTLDGYGFKPEGWFEDYAKADSMYANNDALHMGGTTITAARYRKAMPNERFHIYPLYVTGNDGKNDITNTSIVYVNRGNSYICMTLGIPSAVDDTAVLDYGLDVVIDVQANDIALNASDFTNSGRLSLALPSGLVATNNVYFNTTRDEANYFKGTSLGLKTDEAAGLNYGTATLNGPNLTYSMVTASTMTGLDSFYYSVLHNGYYYYAKVTVIPATSIYYEDNCGMVSFSEASSDGKVAGWVSTDTSVSLDGKVQDCDRPGTSTIIGIDAESVYGYDSHYKNMTTYSMGSAMKTTINANNAATATFTFTGTGFDVISLTSKTTGMIMVTIYEGTDTNGKVIENLMVDTYYSTGTLYQVPVIKKDLKTYDTYTVEIYAAYAFWADHGQVVSGGEWEFYLDAIRIYDPANDGNTDSTGTIKDAYGKDKEGSPIYQELRNMIMAAGSLNAGSSAVSGVVYIDGKTSSLANYNYYGPNNEVYISSGNAIAFTVNELNLAKRELSEFGADLAAVHLGIKTVEGEGAVKIYAIDSTASATEPIEINSATGMYYDISGFENKTIVVYNSGSATLSITDLKATFTETVTFSEETPLANLVTITAEEALQAVNSIDVKTPTIHASNVSLSFEEQVYYNVYFTVDDLGDLGTADMGLITFNSNTDGTIDNADAVIPGAELVNGYYRVNSEGVAAKNLGDDLYFKVYIKLADGSYVYTKLYHYSAKDYAMNILSKSQNASLKSLVVAMLNYGAEAQKFFGHNTDNLMNKDLTAEQQALVGAYTVSETESITVGAEKSGAFVNNNGFDKCTPSVAFESAFAINFYFQPANAVDSSVTFYYWDLETYNSVDVLTAENATGTQTLTAGEDGMYKATCEDIAAKNLDSEVFVAAVYESNGVICTSGIRHYSVGTYCRNFAADSASAMQGIAQATLVYGECAKAYFENV